MDAIFSVLTLHHNGLMVDHSEEEARNGVGRNSLVISFVDFLRFWSRRHMNQTVTMAFHYRWYE
jgi:hypothetical protein